MQHRAVRLSQPALKVLRALLENPRQGQSGAEISKATKVGAGTLYPLLARFESAGWMTGEWEQLRPHETGKPRRRFYKLTAQGQNSAAVALQELQFPTRQLAWAY